MMKNGNGNKSNKTLRRVLKENKKIKKFSFFFRAYRNAKKVLLRVTKPANPHKHWVFAVTKR